MENWGQDWMEINKVNPIRKYRPIFGRLGELFIGLSFDEVQSD